MIHPSYSELIEAINTNNEDDDEALVLNSRYSLVLAASKRARQLIAGAEPLVPGAAGKKPLSVAIDELYKGKVKILPGQEEEEELEALEAEKEALEGKISRRGGSAVRAHHMRFHLYAEITQLFDCPALFPF